MRVRVVGRNVCGGESGGGGGGGGGITDVLLYFTNITSIYLTFSPSLMHSIVHLLTLILLLTVLCFFTLVEVVVIYQKYFYY